MDELDKPQAGLWRLLKPFVVAGALLAAGAAQGTAPAAAPSRWVLAVSKPPAPVLPGDPPLGRLYRAPADLSSAREAFDTTGGPVSLEYLAFDSRGNAFITFDDGPDKAAPGGFMAVSSLAERQGGGFDAARDRWVSGRRAGLKGPKGIVVAGGRGVVIVSDFTGASLRVFDASTRGDVAPLFVTDDLGPASSGRRPWGVAYDAAADRLFVGATDGMLLVYDRYLARRGRGGPDRLVTPTVGGEKASANLHDLLYLKDRDLVVAVDVGAATAANEPRFDTDGGVLVIANASRASGRVPARLRIRGPASLLGNPVGLALDGSSLFVAEKAGSLLLRFEGLLGLTGDRDLAPSGAVTVAEPESVALAPAPAR